MRISFGRTSSLETAVATLPLGKIAPAPRTANLPSRVDGAWPRKCSLLGVMVSDTQYDDAAEAVMSAARHHHSAVVTHLPVHGVVTAARDPKLREQINRFDIVAPDGQPVRWAMNALNHTHLAQRVYGPQFMLQLCERAAVERVGVYLFGSTEDVVTRLKANLEKRFAGLNVVGAESPPFRPLTAQEDHAVVERINASHTGLVFIGLGCPRQDEFASEHRDAIHAVQLCVGAAFDFHAGNKKMAPRWMQEHGLEWLFRLVQEPGRLWKRYLVTNTMFLMLILKRLIVGEKDSFGS